MYRVLWVCSVPPKEISEDMGSSVSTGGGWIHGLYLACSKIQEMELSICFPVDNCKSMICGDINRVKYFSFFQKANIAGVSDVVSVNKRTIADLKKIFSLVKPDILHIFGTENAYATMAFNIFSNSDRTIIHIQGLTSIIARYYEAGLPMSVTHMIVPSIVFRGTIYGQKQKMKKRGQNEARLLKNAKNVFGRTEWDRAHCTEINPAIMYYHCNEILRDTFYLSDIWKYKDCNKHTIFMAQGAYPLKGLHVALEALRRIKRFYPDVVLYVAGSNPVKDSSVKGILSVSGYGIYIRKMIKEYSLEDNIVFTGFLSEKEIVECLLKSNTYLLASYMENSPNSLAEAMLLGMPCVTSEAGGILSMIKHNEDGYVYQHDDPVMLANWIMRTFDYSEDIEKMCLRARKKALRDHDPLNVQKDLLKAYEEILLK